MIERSLSGIRAIVFDLDETLYGRVDWLMPAIEFAATAGNLDGQVACELAVDYINKRGSADAGIYNHILLGMGQSDSIWNIRGFLSRLDQYRAEPGSLQFHPGALEALVSLRDNYRLAVIALGPEELQRNKIRALGLSELVNEIVLVDEGQKKSRTPELNRALTTAMDRLVVRAGFTLFVADNPFKDFISTRPLGVQTVRVMTGEYAGFDYPSAEHSADYDISSVARLPELLQQNPPSRSRFHDDAPKPSQPQVLDTRRVDGNWPGLQTW